MALTEEQLKELALRVDAHLCSEGHVATSAAYAIAFAANLITALPKPEPVAEIIKLPFHTGFGRVEERMTAQFMKDLEVGTLLYTEAPIAQPASAPSEQKPVPAWIGWSGGDCPIKPGEEFKVRLENGEELIGGVEPAWNWSHDDPFCEPIIAYCIVSKPEPQADYKAQRDAERYRFLRDSQEGKTIRIKPRLLWNEEIDAAIASVKGGE